MDFGCGAGAWLDTFKRSGVEDVLGLDSDDLPMDMLRIPADQFKVADLRSIPDMDRRFDIACSLEVAEHLPNSSAEPFVRALVDAAPVVLFSAAVPGQGGTGHVNEQWQSYWAHLFATHGYVAVDCILPAIYRDTRVMWWYRQNMLVFCRPDRVPERQRVITDPYELERIDPAFLAIAAETPRTTAVVRSMLGIVRTIVRRLMRSLPRASHG